MARSTRRTSRTTARRTSARSAPRRSSRRTVRSSRTGRKSVAGGVLKIVIEQRSPDSGSISGPDGHPLNPANMTRKARF